MMLVVGFPQTGRPLGRPLRAVDETVDACITNKTDILWDGPYVRSMGPLRPATCVNDTCINPYNWCKTAPLTVNRTWPIGVERAPRVCYVQ